MKTHDGPHDGTHDECFGCRIKGINFSNACAPSRSRGMAKQKPPKNSWERGIAKDHRGMPRLDAAGAPMSVHRWASERHSFTESLRKEAETSKE